MGDRRVRKLAKRRLGRSLQEIHSVVKGIHELVRDLYTQPGTLEDAANFKQLLENLSALNTGKLSSDGKDFAAAKRLGWTPRKLLTFLRELNKQWSTRGLVIEASPHCDYHLMTRFEGERLSDVTETRFLNLCNPMRSVKTLLKAAKYNGVHETTHQQFVYSDYDKYDEEVLVNSLTAQQIGGKHLGEYLPFARETFDSLKQRFMQTMSNESALQEWLARLAHWQVVLEGHARQEGIKERHARGFQRLAKAYWKLVSKSIGPGTEYQKKTKALPGLAFAQYCNHYLGRFREIYASKRIPHN